MFFMWSDEASDGDPLATELIASLFIIVSSLLDVNKGYTTYNES